jgi:hypothetical protein
MEPLTELKTSKNKTPTFSLYSKLNLAEGFEVEKNNEVPIDGFCVHEGIFNEIVEIVPEELTNVQDSVRNAQFRVDHGIDVVDVVGRVEQSRSTFDAIHQKQGVYYQAFIDNEIAPDTAKRVERNYVNDVSIGFNFYPECSECGEDFRGCEHWFDTAHIIARDIEVFELSLVTRGADTEAKATVSGLIAQFSDKLEKENFKKINSRGGNTMGEEDNTVDIANDLAKAKQEALEAKRLAAEQEEMAKKAQKELEEIQAKQTELEDKIKAQEEQFGTETEARKKLEKEREAEKLATKKEEVTKIVDEAFSKEMIAEEEKESEIAVLMEMSETALARERDRVEKYEKTTEEQSLETPARIEQFMNKVNEGHLGEVSLLDMVLKHIKTGEEPFIQRVVHSGFGYNKTFKSPTKDKLEGKSDMSFKGV